METKPCPRCGSDVLATTGRGRPRLWCSDTCRRLSSEERRAARRGGQPVQIHEEIRDRVVERSRPLSPEGAVERVLSSPLATETLLRTLAHRMREEPQHTGHQPWHSRLKPLIGELAAAYRATDTAPSMPTPPDTAAAPVRSGSADRVGEHRAAVALVLGSPRSIREVLLGLAEQARAGKLSGGEHSSTVTAVESVFGALLSVGAIRRRR